MDAGGILAQGTFACQAASYGQQQARVAAGAPNSTKIEKGALTDFDGAR
jgi:hypothetical protein